MSSHKVKVKPVGYGVDDLLVLCSCSCGWEEKSYSGRVAEATVEKHLSSSGRAVVGKNRRSAFDHSLNAEGNYR